ncbi:hypothetical protein CMUS01_05696 [Colletotrichum musicola]|uniref:F-box domain-containing protein n=1 Tax=Colletotrichum musicola TaxID=2175873 RepID=A0A8H6KRK0_9PEZI|nr:hypothetical protein CMUS01_05696 [Colletotrichum musicola]
MDDSYSDSVNYNDDDRTSSGHSEFSGYTMRRGDSLVELRHGIDQATPEKISARGQELLSLDLEEPLAKSDLAPLYQHLHDVDEALQQITDDWPVRRVKLHGELMQATVIPKQYQEPMNYNKSPFDAILEANRYYVYEDEDSSWEDSETEQFYTDEEYADLHIEIGKQLLQRFNQIRAAIQERSRPHLRALRLCDMPNEIANHIFHYCGLLKGEKPDSNEYDCDKVYPHELPLDLITSLRLTCRSLCEMVSPALLRVRAVRPSTESLDRLDYISRHPQLSKGVRQIHVSASYYDANIAKDPALFVLYAIRRFTSSCLVLSDGYNSDEWEDYTFSEEEEMAFDAYHSTDFDFEIRRPKRKEGRTLKKNDLRRIVDGWRKLIAPIRFENGMPTTSTAEGTEWRSAFEKEKILSEAYDVYRRKYADQELALSRFPQVVCEAMARMPGIYFLEVCDDGRDTSTFDHDYREKMATRKAKMALLTRPMSWEYFAADAIHVSNNHVAPMVEKLLSTLGSHGVKLQFFQLALTPPIDIDCFRITTERIGSEKFSDSLQEFSLDLESLRWENVRSPDGCSLELDGFLRKGPLLITRLEEIHMARGTWTQALDIRREKYDPNWKPKDVFKGMVDDALKGLSVQSNNWGGSRWNSASGAECAAMRGRGAYERAFEGVPSGGYAVLGPNDYGDVHKYISHQLEENPCRPYL